MATMAQQKSPYSGRHLRVKDRRITIEPSEAEAATVDDRGRVSLPKSFREALGLKAGDVVFVRRNGTQLEIRKAPNPFDVLVEEALEDYRAGRSRSIDDVADELGITLRRDK